MTLAGSPKPKFDSNAQDAHLEKVPKMTENSNAPLNEVRNEESPQTPNFALAQAIFRAMKQEGTAGFEDRIFMGEKDQWLKIARRTAEILVRHGYTLTKTEN